MVSVIVATRNRPARLAQTISLLQRQDLPAPDYEIIVVDDGSVPPVVLAEDTSGPRLGLVRLDGSERSAARNAGAAAAKGHIIVFVDDDMTVQAGFLANHLRAHIKWPSALVVGGVSLPDQALETPFGQFRRSLEQQIVPQSRGVTTIPNFCTAQNMSISKALFQELGGFDPLIRSSEDQDLALRHSGSGGKIVFIPEARAIHNDSALHIRAYCRRVEWGSKHLVRFCRRHPNWPDNVERERVNSGLRLGSEPVSLSLSKLIKEILALTPFREALFWITSILERVAPNCRALDRTYRVLLGVHIRRGYRQGAKRHSRDVDKGRSAAHPAMSD